MLHYDVILLLRRRQFPQGLKCTKVEKKLLLLLMLLINLYLNCRKFISAVFITPLEALPLVTCYLCV